MFRTQRPKILLHVPLDSGYRAQSAHRVTALVDKIVGKARGLCCYQKGGECQMSIVTAEDLMKLGAADAANDTPETCTSRSWDSVCTGTGN